MVIYAQLLFEILYSFIVPFMGTLFVITVAVFVMTFSTKFKRLKYAYQIRGAYKKAE